MNTHKLLVFASYLGGGGAEKHTVRLLNSLEAPHYDISVVTPNKKGSYEKELSSSIHIYKVGSKKAFRISSTLARLSCILPLRRFIKRHKPDIVITVTDIHTLIYLLAVKGMPNKPKHIALVQNNLSESYGNSKGLIKKLIYSAIPSWYNKIDKIVALSQGVAQDIYDSFAHLKSKVVVINNIGLDNDLQFKVHPIALAEQRPVIVTCGRLVAQKGYPYLIAAFAQLVTTRPATLLILGEGHLKKEILQLIQKYNLQEQVKLLGFQKNPYAYMAAADLFVLSSLYEGFGNVIVEAMACNVPVIATDCPHGPSEIIQHGISGWLVPVKNHEALAKAMTDILSNEELQNTLKKNGLKRATDFEASKIARQYEEVIRTTILS